MDLSSFAGGSAPAQNQNPVIEYAAQADSPIVNGEVKLTVGDNAFTAAALLATVEIPFANVNALAFADYTVTVRSDDGDFAFSRMGQWAQPFYDALCGAYNKAVLRAFFVAGEPIVKAAGEYRFTENGVAISGKAPIHIYENCVVALPPDGGARRIPLCFVTGMDRAEYEFTLTLGTGERYTFAKLGYDTAPFADAVERQIRALREKALAAAMELAPSLTAAQATQIAVLLPEGATAPMGRLAAIAPSFAAAIEEKIGNTRIADSYRVFGELCDPATIWLGFRKNAAAPDDASETGEAGAPYLFWMIAPSPDKRYLAVEFDVPEGESAATFVYRAGGDFSETAAQLNRALEAISFKREAIRLSDAELRKRENADYYMASKRTASLQFIRANFAGRVIHADIDSWRRRLLELWGSV